MKIEDWDMERQYVGSGKSTVSCWHGALQLKGVTDLPDNFLFVKKIGWFLKQSFYKKWAIPGLFFIYFRRFKHYNFYNK